MRRYDRGHTTYMKINTYTVHVYIYVVFAGTNKSRSCVSQSNQTGKEGRRLTGVVTGSAYTTIYVQLRM